MKSLPEMMSSMVEQPREELNVLLFDKNPQYENYWFWKTSIQLHTYVYQIIAGAGKSKDPMCKLDPSLYTVLNQQRYFGYSLGSIYSDHSEYIVSRLAVRQPGTYLFAPVYNLKKQTSQARPRIWSLTLLPTFSDRKWELTAQVVGGHCSLWPMLPYEILGIVTMAMATANRAALPL